MSNGKLDKTERSADEKSALSSIEVDEKGKRIERKKLGFSNLNLDVLEPTFDAFHSIKMKSGVDAGKAISFLLDCGALMYNHLSKSIGDSLEKIKKANAPD